MGKSRLVQELSTAIEREPELIRWRQGRSLPYGQGVSYWALGEMVKAEAGILESDPADVAETKLREVVARVCAADDAQWIRSLLRPLIGAAEEGGGSDRRAEAFAGWRRFLEGLADERPTVLVFEDLHWADDGLLDFVDGLVEWATDLPLLVVATARPELLTRRAHWGGGKPNATTLSLAPLSEAETAEVVHAVLERAVLPADVQTAVLARAGGNPLYAEEFARLIAERPPDTDGELPVPDSLQGLIAARLDALSRAEKELIQDAAVIGKVFWRGALAARRPHHNLDDVLRALERKEFVRRERHSSVEGDDQYAFRHVLVRDVAYAQIPRGARAERHERAAEWIEARVRPEDAAELLAHHYVSALEYARMVGADVAELERRAATALRDAGRRAVALNAFVNATHSYEEALSLTAEDDPEWPRLALEHAEASTYVDLSGDRFLVRARAALVDAGADDAARAEMVLGEYRWLRGDRDSAVIHFASAEQFAESMSDREARLRVLANLARFAMLADEYERAIRLARPALELAEALARDDMRSHALNTIGTARASMGDARGVDDVEESCEIARRGGGPEYLRSTGNLASILVCEGRLIRASELHREALAIAKEIGYEEPTRWLSTEIAIDSEVAGAWEEARAMVDELIPSYAESPFWIEPQTRVCRGRIAIAEGNVARAVADADRAVELVREARSFQSLCDPFAFRARLHAESRELDQARRLVRELLEIWLENRSGYLDPWVLEAWYAARHTGDEGRLGAAITSMPPNAWLRVASSMIERDFIGAVERLDEMGAASCAALARLWSSEWLVENGRPADAAPFLEPSLAFWRSVGATAYAQRGESLLAAAS
jgi:tetratricopeptide (TPR) repeat protein